MAESIEKLNMKPIKNNRHERFALAIFRGMSQKDAAIEAGYKVSRADVTASELVRNSNIMARISALQEEAKSDTIMTVTERKERLSEIARGRLTDYLSCGPDRDLIDVGAESPNTAALQEVTSRTEYDKDGAGVAVITKIKLHGPIPAISELNKMEHIYESEGKVNIDNRTVTINVNSEKAKELTKRITEGEKTGGDNDH